MNLVNQIKIGISTFFNAIPFIFKNKLGWFFIFPILFNLLIFISGWHAVGFLTDYSSNYVQSIISDKSFPDWLSALMSSFIWLILKVLFFFIYAYLGGFITLIFLSPILAILSEKVDEIITGNSYPFNIKQLMNDILRGILIATRNMFIELIFMILLFILGLIPGLGISAPILMFIISAYFYGFSFMDYSSERNKMNIKTSVSFVKSNKGIAIANGSLFSLCLLIPFFGTMFAGFAAIISTVGATLAIHKTKE